ncbi:MAG: sugar phosphate isomerase/epimerase [bacterium]|nr:sugar phosphate isomerase/epimerase [bacterium]
MLSITSDFFTSTGDPKSDLKLIAKAGFSHIHWCHHWCDDFLYTEPEISYIKNLFRKFSLRLLDLHSSTGKEKNWASELEHERLAGVELVKNRLQMIKQLGSYVIIMHAYEYNDALKKSLDELQPYAEDLNVKIAVENGEFAVLKNIFNDYSPNFIGLCYDSGHGNMLTGNLGLENLNRFKDRLISVHLHDNDGISDQHKPLFTGTINWNNLAKIIAESAYKKHLSLEVSMRNSEIKDKEDFLNDSFKSGNKLAEIVKEYQLGINNCEFHNISYDKC